MQTVYSVVKPGDIPNPHTGKLAYLRQHCAAMFDIAKVWANRHSRSSAWLYVTVGEDKFRIRVHSTARGLLTPTTEAKLDEFGDRLYLRGNPGYIASISEDTGAEEWE